MEAVVKLHEYGTASSREISKLRGQIYKNSDSNMDVYILNEKDKSTFHFPLNPLDDVKIRYQKNYQTMEIVGQGEFDFHKYGTKIREISFKVLIPDDYTEGFNRTSELKSAHEYVNDLVRYMDQDQAVRLIITTMPFDDLVYIASCDNSQEAGMENCRMLNIKFRTHRDIKVKALDTTKSNKINKGLNKTDRDNSKTDTVAYKTTHKDCLWNIAKAKLGKGTRWEEIYNLNKSIIGSNPNKLKVGITIQLPKR